MALIKSIIEKAKRHNVENNLLEGPILGTLAKLAMPVMATAFIQIAYNLVDVFWISSLGTGPVAAVGTAGMFMWFADGLLLLSRMGGQVYTAQRLGAGEREKARDYARASLQMTLFLALVWALILIFGRDLLIGFFRLTEPQTVADAKAYLVVVACGLVFSYWGRVLSALMMAVGNSRLPFYVNAVGLVLNIILDPLLIFGLKMGVIGAALATITAQAVTATLLQIFFVNLPLYKDLQIWRRPQLKLWGEHFRLGLPTTLQACGFSLISMTIARQVASFGQDAIAAQKVGAQVESLTWMSADGFSAALTSFISQNYGGRRYERAARGYRLTLMMMSGVGIFNTLLLFFGAAGISSLFFSTPTAMAESISYLQILALSQCFMCLEILNTAAFNGYGKTLLPSVIVLVCTALRLPASYFLKQTVLGVSGIWWSISMSSVIMGLILTILFRAFQNNLPRRDYID